MSSKFLGWKFGACAVATMVAVACGGESDSGDANNTGGTGGTGAVVGGAGGSGGSGPQNTGGTSVNGTGGAAVGGTGGAGTSCNTAPCEGISVFGLALTPCCMSATQCGVDLAGTCTDAETVQQFADGGFTFPDGGFNLGEPEVIVADPNCAGTTFDPGTGTPVTLEGCCDVSGVCGFSTENIPAFGGFQIPTMCVTNAEAQGGPGGGLMEAGADVPCAYPDSGGGPVETPDSGGSSPDSGSGGDGG